MLEGEPEQGTEAGGIGSPDGSADPSSSQLVLQGDLLKTILPEGTSRS